MHDAPLDMRMDATAPLTAYDVVNTWSYEELRRILFEYGEERYAPAIAKRIVQARETAPVQTTLELAELIRSAMPAAALREKQHPAKRSFQAIRIEVNGEMEALKMALEQSLRVLRPGGRLVVISYHSLEDRLVKNFLRSGNFAGEVEKDFYGRALTPFEILTRKAVVPSDEELERNPRSRSAKLRAAVKR